MPMPAALKDPGAGFLACVVQSQPLQACWSAGQAGKSTHLNNVPLCDWGWDGWQSLGSDLLGLCLLLGLVHPLPLSHGLLRVGHRLGRWLRRSGLHRPNGLHLGLNLRHGLVPPWQRLAWQRLPGGHGREGGLLGHGLL